MKRNVIISALIVLGASIWLGYGILSGKSTPATHETLETLNERSAQLNADSPPVSVRVRASSALEQQRVVTLRGRTQNKRTVVVRAEVTGKVQSAPFERGNLVEEGQPLCILEKQEYEAREREATDRLKEAELIYQGRMRLESMNLNSESEIASAKAAVTSAERQVAETQANLERTTIRAPFNGYVEVIHAFEGDLLAPNSACVTLLDLDPMLVVAQVQEDVIHDLKVGQVAQATLPSGETIEGEISFLGRDAEMATRTFTLEVQVPNPTYEIRSGLTAKLDVPVRAFYAHKINSSLFSLDDLGQFGVRIVDPTNKVRFYPVTIVKEDEDGVWVAGLPNEITLITVGHRFVTDGQPVEIIYDSEATGSI